MGKEENWLLEEFCKRVSELKSKGMLEADAKILVKKSMKSAIQILKGEIGLSEAMLK